MSLICLVLFECYQAGLQPVKMNHLRLVVMDVLDEVVNFRKSTKNAIWPSSRPVELPHVANRTAGLNNQTRASGL